MRLNIITIIYLASSILFNASLKSGINSVVSSDANNVWAVGPAGRIIHSTDAGISWVPISLGTTDYYSVFAVSSYLWIVGNSGILQRSTNAGVSWSQSIIAGGDDLRSIYFIDGNIGWIAGKTGVILKTTDSGINWILQITNTSNNLNSVKFINNDTGVACGSNGIVIKSTNGGNNWSQSVTPVNKELLSIDIKQSTIITSGKDAVVLRSSDMGNSWNFIDYKILTKSDINSVFMMNINTYLSVGGGGFIRKSMDGGQTFSYGINPMLAQLNNIYFYDSNRGWAVSRTTDAVIRTTDGGNYWLLPAGTTVSYSWSRKLPFSFNSATGNVMAFNSFNKFVIYTCVSGKRLYRSPDLGETWSQFDSLPYGTRAQVLAVSSRDTSKMIAVLQEQITGKIFRTTNYGNNWTETFSKVFEPYGVPLEVDPIHPDTVFFAVDDTLYRSTDFGLNWIPISVAGFNDACDIAVSYRNSNIIFISGGYNPVKILKSTDGGYNFISSDTVGGLGAELPEIGISSLDINLVYFTIYNSGLNRDGVKKSTNLGNNWSQITNTTNAWGIDIAKDDPNVISYGVYGGSTSYISVDGGLNFIQTPIPGGLNYSFLFYDRATLLAQQSDGIYKMSVTYNIQIGIRPISNQIPKDFTLYQNYPNPFNPVTKIKFDIPFNFEHHTSNSELIVYDAIGREIAVIVNEPLKPGTYEIEWNASAFPSGVYFCKLTAGDFSESKKMVLVK